MAVSHAHIIAAASGYSIAAGISAAGIWNCGQLIRAITVLTPFGHIARHVVQTQLIRPLTSNRMSPVARYRICPTHAVCHITARKAEMLTFSSASRRIFPLCLCGQTKRQTGEAVQASDKLLAVVPGDIRNGISGISIRTQRLMFRHYSFPQCVGYFRGGNVVRRKKNEVRRFVSRNISVCLV